MSNFIVDSVTKAVLEDDTTPLRFCQAVRIKLPQIVVNGSTIAAYDLRLTTSASELTLLADGSILVFKGSDDNYGSLASVGNIAEALATEAPRLQIALQPPFSGTTSLIANPLYQGAEVDVWLVLVNQDTGNAYPLIKQWVGVLDVAHIVESFNSRVVQLDVGSGWDFMLQGTDGIRLNGISHKRIWPGETGLDHIIAAQVEPYWGGGAPQRQAIDNFRAPGSDPNVTPGVTK